MAVDLVHMARRPVSVPVNQQRVAVAAQHDFDFGVSHVHDLGGLGALFLLASIAQRLDCRLALGKAAVEALRDRSEKA